MRATRVRVHPRPVVSGADRQRALAAVSLLLGYPDDELLAKVPLLLEIARATPPPVATALGRFLAHMSASRRETLAADYVQTFDFRRHCCLYLTYFAFGDTRQRGAALLRFADVYRAAGFEQPSGELPDHLAVVCNFAALAPVPGVALLCRHRTGIELLAFALAESRSPYLDVIAALRAVLPEPTEADRAMVIELARRGPPSEEVGLEPLPPAARMRGK